MIISDTHRFAFVHVPKCAGTSVRHALQPIDETGGMFRQIGEHPAMGRIHHAHITLPDLAAHYPEALAKIRSYRSIAIVRDPTERFVSAIFQRLREFEGYPQSAITPHVIEEEAGRIRRYLESAPARLDVEHVHFNRQVDFIELAGERIVGTVLDVGQMGEVARFVAQATGIAMGAERKNRSTELRFRRLQPLQQLLRQPYVRLVPAAQRERIRERMTRAGVYQNIPKQRFIAEGSATDAFIRAYYARDFALHRACT